jgi:hypothetical protein
MSATVVEPPRENSCRRAPVEHVSTVGSEDSRIPRTLPLEFANWYSKEDNDDDPGEK